MVQQDTLTKEDMEIFMRKIKECFQGVYMALGMFTAIPMPFHFWKEKHTSMMITVYPIVGLVVGGLWWLAFSLLFVLNMPYMLTAATLTAVPFFVVGFIHLDGYIDTSDALLSYRPLEDKLRILKDPNVGAFAVVMLVILFIMQFGAVYTIAGNRQYLLLIIGIMVLSRCCSAFCIFYLSHNSGSNYAPLLAQGLGWGHKMFVLLTAMVAMVFSFVYAGVVGMIVLVVVLMGYFLAMLKAYRGFKGVSGDLLGFALVISECCGLIALAVMQR